MMSIKDLLLGWIPWDGIVRTIDSITGDPVAQTSINGAVPVHLASSSFSAIPPFNATLFTGSAAGSSITASLADYSSWAFQVVACNAADQLAIELSDDGGTFYRPALMHIGSGAVIPQTGADVTFPVGKYVPVYLTSTGVYALLKPLSCQAIKITKTTATAVATVIGFGGWSA